MAGSPQSARKDLDFALFRELLDERRRELLHEIGELDPSSSGDENGPRGREHGGVEEGMSDQATETALREQDQAIQIGLQGSLEQVESALTRLDDGSYGRCTRCSADIPAERLEILPQTAYCITCASEVQSRL